MKQKFIHSCNSQYAACVVGSLGAQLYQSVCCLGTICVVGFGGSLGPLVVSLIQPRNFERYGIGLDGMWWDWIGWANRSRATFNLVEALL